MSEEVNNEEELISVDDQLKQLHEQTEEMTKRYGSTIRRLLEGGSEPATKAELGALYSALTNDVVSLMGEFIAETAAAFRDYDSAIQEIGEGAGDSEDELTEEMIEIYGTLKANVNALDQILKSAMPSDAKESFRNLLVMNQKSLVNLEEVYGDEIKEAFEETLKQAQEGSDATESSSKSEKVEATAPH